MRSQAVIMTFPGHYLSTILAIKSIRKHFLEIQHLTVVADDISNLAWKSYIADCESAYQTDVIPTSNFGWLHAFKKHPWVRQQLVKLHLDQIVPYRSFFYSDGDVIFNQTWKEHIVPYTVVPYSGVPLSERDPMPGEITSQQSYYVGHMLGIEHTGIQINGQRICVSNPPFRDINSKDLSALRLYVERNLKKDFISAHKDIAFDTRFSISEWELIEFFRNAVQHDTVVYETCDCWLIGKDHATGITTHWDHDLVLERVWWERRGAVVPDEIWSMLPEHK